MKPIKFKSVLLLPLLLLALVGCGSDSDDADDDSEDIDTSCTTSETSEVASNTLPEIQYTEVDEGSAANDSRATAQTLQSNTILTGQGSYEFPGAGCVDCDDFFAMTVSEGDELQFELTTPQGMTAFIYLYNDNGSTPVAYNEDGEYEKRLEYTVPSGLTNLVIYISTYQGTGDYELTITTPVEAVAIADVPAAECLANLEGAISNAVSGAVVSGATINLREGDGVKTGDVDYTTTSDAQGNYSFTDVDAGDYTIEIVKADFITHYLDVPLPGEKTTEKKFQLSPTLAEGEELRLVMSWGAQPYILDSYLNGPNGSGGSFTVKYYARTGTGVSLDRDATYGYGPETMTFTQLNEGTYTYWINDYTNRSNSSSTALGVSGANVTVYDSSGIVKQYKVPSGAGTKWNVLTITVDGSGGYTINDVNTLGNWSESP